MTTTTATYPEVVEGIRATLAAHAQAQDDGRTDALVALYCPDGAVEVPGMGTYEGTESIREAFSGWTPQVPQRHIVVNTVVTDWNDQEASAVTDVVFVQKAESGWAVQIVGRYHDVLRPVDGKWLLYRRTMNFSA
jgi:ketosteroid isomerase-like protein